MSQVNKSWNRTARKHHYMNDSLNRSATFQREKRLREEAAARARREAVRNAAEKVCYPCVKLGSWWWDHCCLATCIFVLVLLYVGWSIMIALFIWGPMFVSGPSNPTWDEITSPPFQNNSCVIDGSLVQTVSCSSNRNQAAYRAVFNVTFNGQPGMAAVSRIGAQFVDCNYDPTLLNQVNAQNQLSQYPIGSSWSCYADPLFPLPFVYTSALQPRPVVRSKEFAVLDFAGASAVNTWSTTASIRLAGTIMGYLWIPWTVMILYLVFLLSLKACC